MVNANTRLLVVDDMATMRSLIRKMLRAIGYTTIDEAEDGLAALEKLRAQKVDMVITDWNMPNMDGLSLLQEIRKSEDFAELPVLMVTAEKRRENVLAAIHAGASGYIVKPFSEAALADKLAQIAPLSASDAPTGQGVSPFGALFERTM
ncbi:MULTISPECIES: response regulator [unclassified Caballeronia]|uniref:response regulator n=1 Tax=unclassified Caballeronia TaxID=2646786 RepID=UPI00285F5BF1|nr:MULTISPECIES: response regulator [unclassified Caballeronia]MDR5740574.1 response regulator [Caballeronia sp. LZ016]MDR5808905.1 response regulator [Caballeronia sp. LZ019]